MIKSTTSHYKSSTIDAASYNFADKTLTVVFKWATYVYEAVDVATWVNFNSAESQGKALNEYIKGEFEYTKHEDNPPGSLLDELPPSDYQLDN